MPEDEIRFGVGSADAVHSSTWKIWVHNDEIYLAARHFGRFMKVSLHSTGDWRVAWIQESQIEDRQLPPGSRVLCQWRRPNEFTPGWTQCLHIMVPFCTVQHRFKLHDTGTEIVWAAPPRPGEKVMFTVLLSTAQVLEEAWKMVCQPGDVTLGSLALSNGERALADDSPGANERI